jgi:RimJ/RimL family protein N-acetyltransferase
MDTTRPLGERLDWQPARRPDHTPLRGKHVLLRPLDAERDAAPLFEASAGDPAIWTYLPYGPYADTEEMRATLRTQAGSHDPLFYTVAVGPDELPRGVAAFMRFAPEHGFVEIGHIWFAPALQRTTAASEAIALLARHAFEDLGYRRLEWKCDALNAASRAAAARYGFRLEGVFREHMVVKGRNRDTAWFAITAGEWPAIAHGFTAWLDDANFDADGSQRHTLAELTLTAPHA